MSYVFEMLGKQPWLTLSAHVLCGVIGITLLGGCAPKRANLYRPPRGGYVKEIDEPTARGTLTKVSPDDLNVVGKFIVSPDGEWIIYSARPIQASSSEPYQLYRTSTRSASSSIKLTAGSDLDAWYPSLTLDGKSIIYQMGDSFWRIGIDGSGARTKIGGSGMEWDCCGDLSQQGRYVFNSNARDVLDLFFPKLVKTVARQSSGAVGSASRGKKDKHLVWSVSGTGSELTQYREGDSPRWSPDGKWIVFSYRDDIWKMSAEGGSLTQLTSTAKIYEGIASFSHDGSHIVFTSNEGGDGSNFNIWSMAADGSQKTQLTELDAWDSWPVWTKEGVFFLSGRGVGDKNLSRIWRLKIAE